MEDCGGDTSESKVLTNEDLDAVASCIEERDCYSLAFQLNVTNSEIENCNDTGCLQKTILQVWMSKAGQNATSEKLLEALGQVKHVHIKWDVLQEYFGDVVLKFYCRGDTSESKVLTNEDLDAVASCIEERDCYSLAFQLNVTNSEIETCNDTECLQKTILQVWMSKAGQNATSEKLLEALGQVKHVHIKWDVLQEYFGDVVLKFLPTKQFKHDGRDIDLLTPQQQQMSPSDSCTVTVTVSPNDEQYDAEQEIEIMHRRLLIKLSDLLPVDSTEFLKFMEMAKAFKVSKARIAECKKCKSLLTCFEALESVGIVCAGHYQSLQRIAQLSNNENLVPHICNAEKNINTLKNGNYRGTQHEVHVALVRDAVSKALTSKYVHKVDISLILQAYSKDKEAETLAEEIVFEVLVKKINPSSSGVQTVNEVIETVSKIVSDLQMDGITMSAVSRKCIVIAVQYETYDAVLSLLDYMDSELLKEHLEELSTALGQHLGTNILITFSISNSDLSYIWQELENSLRETKMDHKEVCMSFECSTAEGFKHLVDYFESDRAANNLNQLSEDLSVHIGKHIEVSASLDLNQVHEALSSAENSTVHQKRVPPRDSNVNNECQPMPEPVLTGEDQMRYQKCVHDGRLIHLKPLKPYQLETVIKNVVPDIKIGESGFGKVQLIKSRILLDIQMVLKNIKCGPDDAKKVKFLTNVKLSARIRHFAVVPLIVVALEKNGKKMIYHYFMSPHLPGGSLGNKIKEDNMNKDKICLCQGDRIRILYHIASAIEYLHTPVNSLRNKIHHSDITSNNIVIDGNGNARLTDVSLAYEIKEQTKLLHSTMLSCCTPDYTGEDIINFGIVIRELLTGKGAMDENKRKLATFTSKDITNFTRIYLPHIWCNDKNECSSEAKVLNKHSQDLCKGKEVQNLSQSLWMLLKNNALPMWNRKGDTKKCEVCYPTEAPVKFIKFLSDQKVNDKDAVVLECEVTKPNVQVLWLKGEQELKPDSRIMMFNDQCLHKLLMATVSMDAEGIYTCVCGDERTECQLTVEEIPPKFSKFLMNQEVKEKETLAMECHLTKPNVQVCWLKGGQEVVLSNNRVQVTNDHYLHRLVITDVTMEDESVYTCVCGKERTECQITVKVSSISSELLNSPELIKLYNDALKDGEEKEYRIRVMVVGCYNQGKTSLTRRLLEQSVDDVASTNGVDVHETTCDVLKDGKWKSLDDSILKEEQVKRLVRVASEHSEVNKNSANDNPTNVLQMRDSGHKDMSEPDADDEVENLNHNVQILSLTKNDFENTDTKKSNYDDDNDVNGGDNEMLAKHEKEKFSESSVPKDDIINTKKRPKSEHQNAVTSNSALYMSFACQYTGNNDLDKNCEISLWDFGGQSVFYSTHQLFLSREAVYLLVFDLSRSLDDVIEDVDTGQIRSMKDYLKFWVTSIHCFVGIDASNNGDHHWLPWIFLVGTHKKDPKSVQYGIKKYFNEVRTLFKTTDLRFHLHEKDFSVDNKDFSNAGLEDFRVLKEAILEKADEQFNVALPIPAKWIALEIALLLREDNGILSFKEVLEINKCMNCPLPDDDYIKKFLVYCHEKGRLLYFENASHVVLKPQYLIDAFKAIITSNDHCLRTPALSDWWDKLYNEAKLYPKLIDGLWKDKFMEHRDIILQFLEKHRVICKVVDPHETFFLVPSFLKPSKQEVLEKFMVKPRSKIALVFQFKYLTLVPTIFQHATAAIFSKWVPYEYKTQYLVFENFIGCKMNEGHIGILRMKDSLLELVIVKLPHSGDSSLAQTSDAFRRFVTKCVKYEFRKATRVTHGKDKYSFDMKYRCMDPKHKSTGSVHTKDLPIDIVNKSCQLVNCPDDEHQISLSSALAEWFLTQPNPKELSHIELSVDDINNISKNIYEYFDENLILELGRHLNITPNMNGQHIKSIIYEMLLQWREKEVSAGHNAKLDGLLQALYNCGKGGSMLNDEVRNFLDGKGYSRSATAAADIKLKVSFTEILMKARTELVNKIEPAPLLDHFIENKFISPYKARDIKELPTTSDKNREIIQLVQTNNEDGYELFKTCLQKSNQEDLLFKLTEFETILSQEQEQPRDTVIRSEMLAAADVNMKTDIEEIDRESEKIFSVVTDVDEVQGDSNNDIDISLREYQQELAQEGFQGCNVIIVAPTNTGKTRVASRIIQEHFRSRRKKNLFCCVIFLVENESLAQQQGQVLARLLPTYRTKVISGSIQQAKKQCLKDFITKRDILVVTAQILLNCLKLKEIDSLTKFSMLVFDECHHTDNQHRYNEIMRFYIDLKLRLNMAALDLPQIIGLTASLGTGGYTDQNKAADHMKKLLANMDIMFLCTVQRNIEELKHFENNPIECIVTAKRRISDRYRDVILGIAAKINDHIASHPSMNKLEKCDDFIRKKSKVPENLGNEQFLSWLSDLKDCIGKLTSKELGRVLNPCMQHLEIYNKALTIHNDARIKDAETILKDFMQSLAVETSHETDGMLRSLYAGLNDMSFEDEPENPKLLKMQEILLRMLGNENGRGIIFVKSRELAKALVAWMQDTPALAMLNATEFVGQRAPVISGGMTKRNQKDALYYFKDGKHKILVATSVAEEGLDITKCNLVIRYEHVTNEIVRLQSRGRARAQDSHYFVLTSEGSWIVEKEEKNVWLEQMMSRIVPDLQAYMKNHPNKWENERRQIQKSQKQAEEMMLIRKKDSIVNDCVELQCFNCRQFLCRSSDVRVIQDVHHVCINKDIDKYIRKYRKPNPMFTQNDLQFDGSIICANKYCTGSFNLGSMCEYKHAEYPLIKITQIRVLYANGEGRHFKKWKDVNFEIAPFSLDDLRVNVYL